jgi:hypothetical protein
MSVVEHELPFARGVIDVGDDPEQERLATAERKYIVVEILVVVVGACLGLVMLKIEMRGDQSLLAGGWRPDDRSSQGRLASDHARTQTGDLNGVEARGSMAVTRSTTTGTCSLITVLSAVKMTNETAAASHADE